MSEYIKKEDVLGIIVPRMNSTKIVSLENQILYSILEEVRKMSTFDLDEVFQKITELQLSVKDKELFVEDEGYATMLRGRLRGIADVLEILKSAANATNGKNGV